VNTGRATIALKVLKQIKKGRKEKKKERPVNERNGRR
jgi:hypothetical protein